jgi:hypothetical protein
MIFMTFTLIVTCMASRALQMKGHWESNINVWFPFMYFQKCNCYFQNRIIMFCLPVPTFIYLRDLWIGLPIAAGKYVDWSLEYINRSQTHECGNWDWGRAIPRKGIQKWDFPCSVVAAPQEVLLHNGGFWNAYIRTKTEFDYVSFLLIEKANIIQNNMLQISTIYLKVLWRQHILSAGWIPGTAYSRIQRIKGTVAWDGFDA